MNILYLTNHLNTGGITSYVLTLASGLKKRGHNIYLASGGGEMLASFQQNGIIYLPLPLKTKAELSPQIFFSALGLARIVRQYGIELIHANSRTTQVVACLTSRLRHIAYISTCHGFFKKRILRRLFPCWGNKVIAVSEQVREHLLRDFKVEETDIRLVNNGIDIDRFGIRDPAYGLSKKKELGLGQGPVVGIVARLSDVKGHVYLIEAMQEVMAVFPAVQLLIVGEGKMQTELMRLTRRLGIERRVFFLPSVRDTAGVLLAMDIFVLPSLREGLGLSLMEAMAMGLAVVASDIGGIKSLVRHGDNGLLVEAGNVRQLSAAILTLLKDKDKAKMLGRGARSTIEKNFSQDKMILATEKVYAECLKVKN